jgi:hypothetical protein
MTRRLRGLLLWLLLCAAPAHAANYSVFCSQQSRLSAEQKNRMLLFSDSIRSVLQQSGHDLALVARAGIDLDRFGLRYSHAGISLKQSGNTPWSVRQLYYSCAESRPMLYDQGLAGFMIDQNNSRTPFVSLVFLSGAAERELEHSALDNALALRMLAGTYSADAYAFSTTYQNCNQWLLEMLAHAWGHLPDSGDVRADAQQWLQGQRYQPSRIEVHNPLILLGGMLMPLLHNADHPAQNLRQGVYEVSLPGSLEAFVQHQQPQAARVEMCMNERQIVIHHGWDEIAQGCVAAPADSVLPLS